MSACDVSSFTVQLRSSSLASPGFPPPPFPPPPVPVPVPVPVPPGVPVAGTAPREDLCFLEQPIRGSEIIKARKRIRSPDLAKITGNLCFIILSLYVSICCRFITYLYYIEQTCCQRG
ncbi:MAG: hypothetical protein E3J72_03570 [Planctomycetota bacterium]|nr:MAG: hypothetical protein E3J72_03570 [Planctomycetota bacterium]